MIHIVKSGASILLAAVLFALVGVTSASAVTLQDDVYSAVNNERAATGLKPLQRDATLEATAQEWAQHMQDSGTFAHSSNEWRAARIPAGWALNGENIAFGYRSVGAVMVGWMNSPGHRANILGTDYTRVGVGYVAGGNYWVQVFAGYRADAVPQLTSAPVPTVTGTPRVGETVTANAGTWGPAGVSLSYQWRSNGNPIGGATGSTFAPRALDVGARLTVSVTGFRSGYASAARTSAATAAVATNLSVKRLAGADRFAVAEAISQRGFPNGADTVYLVTGTNYPDALSAAPAAIKQHAPLLLTQGSSLPASTRAEIKRLAPNTVVVVGGQASVAESVLSSLRKFVPTVTRVSGADRYAASRAVADYAFGRGGSAGAYVSTGSNFPDALSAGSPAGAAGSPVLLVDGASGFVDSPTLDRMNELGVNTVKVAGGPASVSAGAVRSLSGTVHSVVRLSGADRFAASIAINADAYSRSSTVYLATGLNFPDALAGSVLAGSQSAPLFVVPSSCVPQGVLAQFDRLGTTDVVLLGGSASLTDAVGALVPCGW